MNKQLYKIAIEHNEPIKGYISKDEERAEIIYNHPDNEKREKREKRKYKEEPEWDLPVLDEIEEIPIVEPVIYIEAPKNTTIQRDLKQERRNAVNNARIQQRTVKSMPNINPQTKVEYINKPIIGLGQNTYIVQPKEKEEFTIGQRETKTPFPKQEKNYDEIAAVFYPNMEAKSEINLKPKKSHSYSAPNSKIKTPDISNVEKTLYSNGTLADMAPKKIYNLVDANQNAIKNRHEKLEQREVAHNPKNIIAVDYIHVPKLKKHAEDNFGVETAENLLMSKSEYYLNTEYAKQHLIFNNYLEVNSDLQEYLKNKITEQLGEDKLLTTKGIYIASETDSSKRLAEALVNNNSFIKVLIENKDRLKNKIPFDSSIKFTDNNFHYALGNADLLDIHINKKGDIDLLVADTYDFNPGDKNDLVQVAYERQKQGKIKPYFIIYHVIIPKSAKIGR